MNCVNVSNVSNILGKMSQILSIENGRLSWNPLRLYHNGTKREKVGLNVVTVTNFIETGTDG